MKTHRTGMMRASRKLLSGAVACAIALFALPVLLTAAPASAAPTPAGAPSFIFAPYNVATQGVIRASLHYTMLPGSSLVDSLVLANPSAQEQTFRIWSADAYNTALGGAMALRIAGYPMTQVGTWITLPTGAADYGVAPGQEIVMDFRVTVPPNAIPGDHVGGVEALDISQQQQPGSGNRVVVHQGIGVPIFVTVPGHRHPSAAVTVVTADTSVPALAFITSSSKARIGYQVQNTGNTILRGSVHVWVTNLFGQTVETFPSKVIGNLIPGQLAAFPTPLWQHLPIAGPQTVHVSFSPVGAATATGSTTFWIWPWVLIILIVLALALLARWLWRRHRRKIAGKGPDGSGSEGRAVEPDESESDEAAAGVGALSNGNANGKVGEAESGDEPAPQEPARTS